MFVIHAAAPLALVQFATTSSHKSEADPPHHFTQLSFPGRDGRMLQGSGGLRFPSPFEVAGNAVKDRY
jgi:hypothetical protein